MAWCEQCGASVVVDARFCGSCGAARRPAQSADDPGPEPSRERLRQPAAQTLPRPGASRAHAASPASASSSVPSWAKDDWIVAVVAALILLGICVAAGITYGAVLGFASTSKPGALVSGALTGAFLPFAMFGIEAGAVRFAGEASAGFGLKTLPLPLAVVTFFATVQAIRFGWTRVTRRSANLVAFVGKVALIVTIEATVLASLMSIGDPESVGFDVSGDGGFVSRVSAGTAAVYPFLIIGVLGVGVLLRRRVPIASGRLNRVVQSDVARSLGWGALAFVGVAAVMALVTLIGDVVVADDGKERLATIVGFLATGLNRGSQRPCLRWAEPLNALAAIPVCSTGAVTNSPRREPCRRRCSSCWRLRPGQLRG